LKDLLIQLFGWRAGVLHGNSTVYDRWRFLQSKLPRTRGTGERILDVGCGTGAFSMGMASRGYEVVGMSWDIRNQEVAERRARLSKVSGVTFPIGDARMLNSFKEYESAFDAVVCLEVIEHIIDDRKLFKDMFACLKPGGRLILSTPNHYYRSTDSDMGPFSKTEDGWHVRRGYTAPMIKELCQQAGFEVEEIGYVSFFFCQLVTTFQTWLGHSKLGNTMGQYVQWGLTAVTRIVPIILDPLVGKWFSRQFDWPGYCITLVAYKKRFS
jgi:SAM-dependent methyltransferase